MKTVTPSQAIELMNEMLSRHEKFQSGMRFKAAPGGSHFPQGYEWDDPTPHRSMTGVFAEVAANFWKTHRLGN